MGYPLVEPNHTADQLNDDRAFAILALGGVAPENEFYVQEATTLLDHESPKLRGRVAMSLLQTGNKNEKVISMVKDGIEGSLEITGIFAAARASDILTGDEKTAFTEAAGKLAGSFKSYKSNIAYYGMHKLKGDLPQAVEAYERSLGEKGPLAMASWHEMPFLPDSEFSQLAPVIVEKMKENRRSPQILSFSFRLSELANREGIGIRDAGHLRGDATCVHSNAPDTPESRAAMTKASAWVTKHLLQIEPN